MCERSGGKPWRTMKVKAALAAEVGTLHGGHHRPIMILR